MRDVVATRPAAGPARRRRVTQPGKRPAGSPNAGAVAHIDEDRRIIAYMIDMLRNRQPLEELHGQHRPSRNLARDLLDRSRGALGLPVAQHVGDVAAQEPGLIHADLAHRARADQLGDVGQRPGFAGLDEPVVVELVDVALENAQLGAHDLHQCLKRPALFGVQCSEMAGQALEQVTGLAVTHRKSPEWTG